MAFGNGIILSTSQMRIINKECMKSSGNLRVYSIQIQEDVTDILNMTNKTTNNIAKVLRENSTELNTFVLNLRTMVKRIFDAAKANSFAEEIDKIADKAWKVVPEEKRSLT